jgi:uncharacterized protein YdeI (YjbR/CyaY-like superfamily)
MNPKVDDYINKAKLWQTEIKTLRSIALDCGLIEELKWGVPVYTFNNKNIVLIGAFKENVALSFLKGVFLNDSEKILTSPGANSRSVKMARFINNSQITKLKSVLKAYIFEAIEVEKSGLKVKAATTSKNDFPEELKTKFKKNSALKKAFMALTPGRQRAYIMFFSDAKQSSTRVDRIEKYTERIINGKGMNDCVCGLSKKIPACDGSHKYIK